MAVHVGRPMRRNRTESTASQFDTCGTTRIRNVIVMVACHQASAMGMPKMRHRFEAMTSQIATNNSTPVSHVIELGASRHANAPLCPTEAAS